MSGLRYNQGKSELSMILEARHALGGCAKVLEFGKVKYDRGNWRKGLSHAQICDSMLRHLSAYLSGEDNDPESGLPHVDHVLTNALFLSEMTRTHPDKDDRSQSNFVEVAPMKKGYLEGFDKHKHPMEHPVINVGEPRYKRPISPCVGHAYHEED